ncbi:MAG TPA: hypothetical protein VE870_12995 [Bacteroidales bacterium]|nr:hypothetical protein [Bacteroidales bacterium]
MVDKIAQASTSGQSTSFSFSIKERAVMLAGSRNRQLPPALCKALVQQLHFLGLGFLVGCANGVDRAFRKVLCAEPYCHRTFVACAFHARTKPYYTFGLEANVVVPPNLSPRAALHRRTVWMVRTCQMLIVFPVDPKTGNWGRGSSLALTTACHNFRPVFIAAKTPPPKNPLYIVLPGELFGLITGYWAIPHPVSEGGYCHDDI